MVGWHHRLNGHEFEQAPGDGEGQGSLACCSLRGHKESDMTERLNNTMTAGIQGLGAHWHHVCYPSHCVLLNRAVLFAPFINSFIHFQAGKERQN